MYNEKYWDKCMMVFFFLLFYLGIDKKIEGLYYYNFFFDVDFKKYVVEIYDQLQWLSDLLFYVCVLLVIDFSVVFEGKENLFVFIFFVFNLEDIDEKCEIYFNIVMDCLEDLIGQEICKYIVYKWVFVYWDFEKDYYVYKGNVYGLVNMLF